MDLRNQDLTRCIEKNEDYNFEAQNELTESNEELYYPILDRIHESLHEKYIEGLYKKKTGSPYSVTLGNNLNQYGENYSTINRQLINLIDNDSVYVKNLIMRNLDKINGMTDKTKEYIISKCRNDANFVVRMVCSEVEGNTSH